MSALGDLDSIDPKLGGVLDNPNGNIHSVAIPFCVLHSIDDPLITWRTVANNEGFMHPENLTKSGKGNTMILLTSSGGHVGWPLGWLPFLDNWKWMSDVAMSFGNAVDKAKRSTPKAGKNSTGNPTGYVTHEPPIRVTVSPPRGTDEEVKTVWVGFDGDEKQSNARPGRRETRRQRRPRRKPKQKSDGADHDEL